MDEIKIHPLQQARKKLGIKQKVLADLTGLSEATIKRAEGGNALDTYTIAAICEYFSKRYGRQVEPHELGLRPKWEDESNLHKPNELRQRSEGDLLPTQSSIVLLAPKPDLLLKIETRDWSVWAGLKLVQVLKMINSYNEQTQSYEEICEEIQTFLDQEIRMLDEMMPQGDTKEASLISRQQALIMIAALPSTVQGTHSLLIGGTNTREFLSQCAASITACWHLLQGKGLAAVEEILSTYLPTLLTLTTRPSEHQGAAARLATLASILKAIIAKHRLKDIEREKYSYEAVRCSQFTADNRLRAGALMTLGYTYLFNTPCRPKQAIEILQSALQSLGTEISLIRSDIYIALADAYAQCEEEQEALKCIRLAQEHFPLYPEHDPSFLYADCSLPVIHQWEGKMYLHLAEHFPAKNYYRKARDAFDTAANIQLLHDRGISEIIIDQADVARGMGELPLYVDHLRRGIMSAATLGSQRRYNEAYAVYQKAPKKWLPEKQFLLLARDIFGGQLPEGE